MKKIIVIDYKLFAKDVAQELDILNHEVFYVSHQQINDIGLASIIASVQPDFLITINFSPEVAYICSSCKIKYVSWTVDPLPPSRFEIIEGTTLDNCIVFTHRTEDTEKFKRLGFNNSYHLLLAASRGRQLQKAINNSYQCDISFVGVTLYKEYEKLVDYITRIAPDLKFYTLENLLMKDYQNVITSETIYNEREGEIPNTVEGLLKDFTTELFDHNYLSSLINGFYSFKHRVASVTAINGIMVYGDEFWSSQIKNYRGIADHGEELNAIYYNSTLNYDVSRFYQKSSVNMRVFDAMACGGVILTESNNSINNIFSEDTHYINSLDPNWSDVLANKAKLNGIAFKAYKEVNAKHRVENRVAEILEKL